MSGGESGASALLEDHEEHENHERWLITYADMITLLMAFFIMLFAMSQLDLAKFKQFQGGVAAELGGDVPIAGGSNSLMPGGRGLLPGAGLGPGKGAGLGPGTGGQSPAEAERDTLDQVQEDIAAAAKAHGFEGVFAFQDQRRGLAMQLEGGVLFAPGSAELTPEGKSAMDDVAMAIRDLPNPILIEGHTDNVPIRGRFADNWELSSARAIAVLHYLSGQRGITTNRLSAAGYADTHPVAPNDTAAGRARNRRVEIVVLAMAEETVRETRPGSAQASAPAAKPAAKPAARGGH